jgi:hypothetical protein
MAHPHRPSVAASPACEGADPCPAPHALAQG